MIIVHSDHDLELTRQANGFDGVIGKGQGVVVNACHIVQVQVAVVFEPSALIAFVTDMIPTFNLCPPCDPRQVPIRRYLRVQTLSPLARITLLVVKAGFLVYIVCFCLSF